MRGAALVYLGVFVFVPLAVLCRRGLANGVDGLVAALGHPFTRSALRLTFETAAIMTAINAVMGTLLAYVLVRYRFRGRTLLGLLIDLPFSIPTLVAGLMIVLLFGPDTSLGQVLRSIGIRVLYAPPAIVIALLFVTLPIVTRAVEPVLAEVDVLEEEAAYTLGASEWTAFSRVVLPAIWPAILQGSLLSFGRALGEFGSVVVVAGNLPRRTLLASVHVFGEVESGSFESASAVSLVLVAASFGVILATSALGSRRLRRA